MNADELRCYGCEHCDHRTAATTGSASGTALRVWPS